MGLATRNFFLDTNIYEQNNFFHSSEIQSMFNYSQSGFINLFLTDISKMEMIDRMHKNLKNIQDDYNFLIKKINKTRILNNLPEFSDISQPILDTTDALNQLIEKLERIIQLNKISIISSTQLDCYDVFRSYFNIQPPFSISKKTEFKDAFIIKAVETWCTTNRKKMIFVSKDPDFKNYRSNRIIIRNNLTDLLQQITELYDVEKDVRVIPTIHSSLHRNKEQILDLINDRLGDTFIMEVDYEKITPLSISYPNLQAYNIISLRKTYAEVSYLIEVIYSFAIIPTVNEMDKSIFEDSIKKYNVKDKIILNCILEIPLFRPNDIRLKWINSNQKVRITV